VAKILLIDDDEALLRALRIGLSARGYDVVLAAAAPRASSSPRSPSPT